MGYIQGESRQQQSMFPPTLDDFVPSDHVCRVIEAFVNKLEMGGLGFQRAEPADRVGRGTIPAICSSFICTAICTRCAHRDAWKLSADAMWK